MSDTSFVDKSEINNFVKTVMRGTCNIGPVQSRDDFMKEVDEMCADFMNGTCHIGPRRTTIETVISTDIIHTRKSREKMGQSGVTQQEVIETINDSSKVNQNDTILCNGRRINVRLVKKEEKYLVIDVYVNNNM